MGAFNVVHADVACPRCGTVSHVGVQFKYGATRQYEYSVDDELAWGGNDVGTRGHHTVVVDGIVGDDCQPCGFDGEWGVYVQLRDDRIVAVEPATGCHDFAAARSTFIVLGA
jgi:hypothetical protein